MNLTKIKNFLVARKFIAIGVLLLLICFLIFRDKSNGDDSFIVKKADFVKTISVSGKVVASQSVDLSFETPGTISNVYKKAGDTVNKGDIIVSLNYSELYADRLRAEADVLEARARLDKLSSSSGSSGLVSDKLDLVNSIIGAYTTADDAVYNKVDQYFENTDEPGPEIKYTFDNYFERKIPINKKRAVVQKGLREWKDLISGLSINNYSPEILSKSRVYLLEVKDFLDTVAPAVFSFEESNSLSQTTIEKYKSDLSAARSNVIDALNDLTSAEKKYSGATFDVSIESAGVKAAEADVASIDAKISQRVLRAPFTGIVSLQDGKVGQSVSANEKIAAMISSGFEVEAFIPEVNISGIALENKAKISLDAYSGEFFEATIIHIDPAETLRDGVSNYKIKLAFTKADPRVLSGMTADVEIVAQEKKDVILVPERVLINESEKYYVLKMVGKDNKKEEVVIGEKDGRGGVEIISGAEIGDELVLNPVTQ